MKFRPGDEVIVNGTQAVIRSWPADDSGPFNYEMAAPGGGRTSAVGWINPDMELEPAHGGYDVRLVRRAALTPAPGVTYDWPARDEQAWLDSIGEGPDNDPHGMWEPADMIGGEVDTPRVVAVAPAHLPEDATDDEWLAFISRNDSVGRNE